jgi:predicted transposase/invertase (TIGR01784 family)
MILDIDPKVDYAFKRVYGREENRDVLESILEAVLADTEFGTVTDLEILNPFNERDTIDDKLSVVDVRARQKSGEVFNVEMQLHPFNALPQRLLYYWSGSYAAQLDNGNQ